MNGSVARLAFEDADKAVNEMLHEMADYVNSVANGNAITIESAGFTATSNSRKPAVVPAAPNAPKISGNAAELHLSIGSAIAGAASYCWVIFKDKSLNATIAGSYIVLPAEAVVIPDGAVREVLRNAFAPGTTINVQVLAQNTAGKSGFSAAVSFTVGS